MNNIIEVKNVNGDYAEERMDICKQCPLYILQELVGPICNSKLYLNTKTNKLSDLPREGYKNGCGCLLERKVLQIENHCPLHKW